MSVTRRSFLLFSLCALAQRALSQQGVASRDLKAQAAPPPSGRPFNAHFADIAEAAGLNSPVIYGGVDTKKYILEANGCGCASLTTTMMAGQTSSCFPAPVWKEIRRKRRIDCTETIATAIHRCYRQSGLRAVGWANGVCVADYNNDRFDDIFCTSFGHNRLYRNNGDGTFTDVTKQSGLWEEAVPRWGAGCAFLDYDRDGHLDLFVSHYIRFDLRSTLLCPDRTQHAIGGAFRLTVGPRGLPTNGTNTRPRITQSLPSSTRPVVWCPWSWRPRNRRRSRTELWAGRGAAGRAPDRGAS